MGIKREREDKEHQPARSGPSIPCLESSVGIPAVMSSSSASDPEDEAALHAWSTSLLPISPISSFSAHASVNLFPRLRPPMNASSRV